MGGQGRFDGRLLAGEQGAKGVLGTLALSVISGPDAKSTEKEQKFKENLLAGRG